MVSETNHVIILRKGCFKIKMYHSDYFWILRYIYIYIYIYIQQVNETVTLHDGLIMLKENLVLQSEISHLLT